MSTIQKRFDVAIPEGFGFAPSYNISPGKLAPVITSETPGELQLFRFGLTPFWSKKKGMMFINARAEGDHNPDDATGYKGAKGIIAKPAFRKPIRSQRCLIPADAFIEGTTREKLSKPFVVYLKEQVRPFAFAGIWDVWADKETGEEISSFAIITAPANALLQKIPHHRSPVILHREYERQWLDPKAPLEEITSMLEPYPAERMNAYPIDPKIKSPREDGRQLIEPVGERLVPEYDIDGSDRHFIKGMGRNKRNRDEV